MKILCIHRAKRFSPNSEQRDALIMDAIQCKLLLNGHHVVSCNEDELHTISNISSFQVIISMARSTQAINALQTIQKQYIIIWNNPSQESLSRTNLLKKFVEHGIPMPDTQFVTHPTQIKIKPPFWVKQGGSGAETTNDVVFIHDCSDIGKISIQRVECAIVSHAQGDLIKFYGIQGTDFFYYYYPTMSDNNFSKFGLEKHNGLPKGIKFSESELKSIANHAATISGWSIYGGDCIISEKGNIYLIDFNDFPSFSSCRQQAAHAIATRIGQ